MGEKINRYHIVRTKKGCRCLNKYIKTDAGVNEEGNIMEGTEGSVLSDYGQGIRQLEEAAENLGRKERLFYSAGGMGASFVWVTAASFLPIYCTDVAKIPAGTVGLIMIISRLLDGFADLYMGFVVGRTKSKWGKARPWMLWSAVPMAFSLLLLFHIPETGSFFKAMYLLAAYFLMEAICFTTFGLPYNTMLSLMPVNSYDRSVVNTVRCEAVLIIQLAITSVTMPLIQYLGGGQEAWSMVSGIYAVCCVLLILTAFKGTRERTAAGIHADSKSAGKNENPVSMLKALCENKYSRLLTIVTVIIFASLGLSAGARIYYAKYVLGDEGLNSVMVIFNIVPTILILLVMPRLLKSVGKIKVLFIGGCIYGIGLMIIMADPQNLVLIFAGQILQGIGQGGLFSCLYAVAGDVSDYCRWKDNISEEAVVYSMIGFGQKVGTGIGIALLCLCLSLGSYNSATASHSALALFSIKALYLYLPLALTMLVLFFWYLFMDLDADYLEAQRKFIESSDPSDKKTIVEKREKM